MARDIYQEITDKIVVQLEADPGAWQKSWRLLGVNGSPRRENGESYRGVNAVILACQCRANPFWLTYNRATALGGQVARGEKATTVVFFKPLVVKDTADATGEASKTIPLLRHFSVFNAEQVDGLPERFFPKPVEVAQEERIAAVDAYINATGSVVTHGGDRACYIPSRDEIRLPEFSQFVDAVAYYGVSLHEHVHWTGNEKRCDRNLKNAFGGQDYAKEELVAEIGAAFLCGKLGLSPEPRLDHAQYLLSWLKVLKDDKKAIFRAAAAAQVAVDYLDALQPSNVETPQLEEAA